MLRKSVRLQDVGYYTEEGTPTLSYREILYRVFRRRKGLGGGQYHMDSTDPHESMNENDSTDTAMDHESMGHHESIANRLRSQIITSTDRTPSVFTRYRSQSITSTERTLSINTTDRTLSINTTERTLSINTTERTLSINTTERTLSINTTDRTLSINTTGRTPSINTTDRTPSVFTRYRSQSINTTERTLSINTTERTLSINTTDRTPSINTTDRTPSINTTGRTPSINTTDRTPSINTTDRTPSINTTDRTPSINTTDRTPSINTTDRTPSINTTGRTPSINTTDRTPSINTTDRTPSINTTDRTQIIPCFLLLLLLAVGFTQYTHTCIQLKEVQQEVQMLKQSTNTLVPLADTMANFALESLGARVLRHLSSDTYWSKGAGTWDRLFFGYYSSKAQRRVIQGQSPLLPGQCWPFAGSHGHLFVSLSHLVSITHVTLGHIPKSQNGHISRAPREFSIYGMSTTDEDGTYLGTLVYDQDSAALQTFELPNPDMGVFRYVKLQINSNWGHMENTCLYSFRVHSNSKV